MKQNTVNEIIVPMQDEDRFYENAGSLTPEQVRRVIGFGHQALRSIVSRHLSAIHPDEEGQQVLDCNICIDCGAFGMSSLQLPSVTRLIQYQGGELGVVYDDCDMPVDFDECRDDELLCIADALESHCY